MCTGYSFPAWQAKAIQLLVENGIEPALLIIDGNQYPTLSVSDRFARKYLSSLLYRICRRIFYHPHAVHLVDMKSLLINVPLIHCETEKKGFSDYFSHADVQQISDIKLDFILRFGFSIIRGKILGSARYGIWSFHHGDEEKYRGGPPGLWEIIFREPVTGAILQRLTDRLDSGIILKKGYFKTLGHSWSGTIDQLYTETAHWPLQVVTDIRNHVADMDNIIESHTRAPVYRIPTNMKMCRFLLNYFRNNVSFQIQDLFKSEKWNIGIINQPLTKCLEPSGLIAPEWLPERKRHHYAADPFAIPNDNSCELFFESYGYRKSKGEISRIILDPSTFEVTGETTVLSKSWHLSYPYLLFSDDSWYCIPESAGNRKIDLYQIDKSGGGIQHVKTLLDEIDAVDPTLFFYNGLWWLFFTRKYLSDTHLFAWYSDRFSGPFEPHKNNPVKSDVRASRPAGTPFLYNGSLFRPAQDCSLTYGGRIIILQVVKLTPEAFEEKWVTSIEPFNNSAYCKGTHTIAWAGNYTVVDGKRFVFDRFHFSRQLRRKVHKIIGANPSIPK
jgi:hypothetical protein